MKSGLKTGIVGPQSGQYWAWKSDLLDMHKSWSTVANEDSAPRPWQKGTTLLWIPGCPQDLVLPIHRAFQKQAALTRGSGYLMSISFSLWECHKKIVSEPEKLSSRDLKWSPAQTMKYTYILFSFELWEPHRTLIDFLHVTNEIAANKCCSESCIFPSLYVRYLSDYSDSSISLAFCWTKQEQMLWTAETSSGLKAARVA